MFLDLLYLIISSLIQSATEFLPVSSSGHLFFWHLLFVSRPDDFYWDAMMHAGSLIAIVIYFRHDLKKMLIQVIRKKSMFNSPTRILVSKLIVATIPAAATGYLAEDWIKNYLRSVWLVVAMLIIISLLFFFIEKKSQQRNVVEQLSWRQSILIGLAQCFAFIPGTSRSGVTIIAGMSCQLTRKEAARYSFLLAIPILTGAEVKGILTIASQGIEMRTLIMLMIGLFITFCFSFLFIKFLLNYLSKSSLVVFAWYRLSLAALMILTLILY